MWHTCVVDKDYEICDEYPYNIRKRSNKRIVSEYIENTGYPRLNLNCKKYTKHRIVALQFIPNDDPVNKTEVDHIIQNSTDYHISNLRWVTKSENAENKRSIRGVQYEWFDEEDLPEDSFAIININNRKFKNYYYSPSTDLFYFFNGVRYRALRILYNKYHHAYVNVKDYNRKNCKIRYEKFKREHNLN